MNIRAPQARNGVGKRVSKRRRGIDQCRGTGGILVGVNTRDTCCRFCRKLDRVLDRAGRPLAEITANHDPPRAFHVF